jgi:hypothetical protein
MPLRAGGSGVSSSLHGRMVLRKAMALFHSNSTKCDWAALLDHTSKT